MAVTVVVDPTKKNPAGTLNAGEVATISPNLTPNTPNDVWLTNPHGSGGWCSAWGNGVPAAADYPVPGASEGCMVAWCGTNIQHLVPGQTSFGITGPGDIQLGANDDNLSDNQGSILAIIDIGSNEAGHEAGGHGTGAPTTPAPPPEPTGRYLQIAFTSGTGAFSGSVAFQNYDLLDAPYRLRNLGPNTSANDCAAALAAVAGDVGLQSRVNGTTVKVWTMQSKFWIAPGYIFQWQQIDPEKLLQVYRQEAVANRTAAGLALLLKK